MKKSVAMIVLAKAGIRVKDGKVAKSQAGKARKALASYAATAGYSDKDWKMASKHLETWSDAELKEWAEEAGLHSSLDRDDIIEVFLDQNGQALIDELKEEAKEASRKKARQLRTGHRPKK